MGYLSLTWNARKSAACVVVLSLCSVTLIYVIFTVSVANYNMFPLFEQAEWSPSNSSVYLNSKHLSRFQPKASLLNVFAPLDEHVEHTDKIQNTPSKMPNKEFWKIPSVKMNINHSTVQSMKHKQTLLEKPRNIQQEVLQQPTLQAMTTRSAADESMSYFRILLDSTEYKLYRDTIQAFDRAMTKNGLQYMIYGGSLLGSYRHHGMIPWDDDIDVLLPESAEDDLELALETLSPHYILHIYKKGLWKLYSANSSSTPGYSWKWPYLDIFFYSENENYIILTWSLSYMYPKSLVFPLKRRPFMGLQLPVPYHSRAFLGLDYNIDMCVSGGWSHKHEIWKNKISIPCPQLYLKFPFVFRTYQNGGCNESLIHNGTVLGFYFEKNNIRGR